MLKLILNILVLFTLNFIFSDIISSAQTTSFSGRQLGQSIAQCFGENQLFHCLEGKIFEALDQAIANNKTWKMNDFLVVEKNAKKQSAHTNNNNQIDELTTQPMSLSDRLASKVLQLAQTRSMRIQLPSSSVNRLLTKRSIYSALGHVSPNVDDVNADDLSQELEQEEGRKRKHNDKNMAIVGGMAMLAMVAQMFLGKVILIAGAAFVMAKVALIVSTLGSLKKRTVGSPVGADHVIVSGVGGVSSAHSHEHISSWHRKTPLEYNVYETVSPSEPLKYFEAADNNYKKTHNPYKKAPNHNALNTISLQ